MTAWQGARLPDPDNLRANGQSCTGRVAPGKAFLQELKLNDGCIEITKGAADAETPPSILHPRCTLRLWVDANHPVIHLTAESAVPLEATALVDLWRTNREEQAELRTNDVLVNRKLASQKQAPMLIEPDTVLAG